MIQVDGSEGCAGGYLRLWVENRLALVILTRVD